MATLLAGYASLASAPAQAATPALLPSATVSIVDSSCGATMAEARPARAGFDASVSKSSAILSGATSALERIRQQQAGLVKGTEVPVTATNQTPLERTTFCPMTAFIATSPIRSLPSQPQFAVSASSEDFLATRRIAIGKTPFDRQWQRVAHAGLTTRQVTAAMGSGPARGEDALSRVNAWVNTQVRHVEDRVARRAADHWATAGQTLRLRSGDCEDFAILKYQMLAALGVSREDMYLTLARDLVRNADHAVLIVKHQGRFYMLDNSTNELLDAAEAHDYRAMMSFTDGHAFLHGARNPA